MSIDLESLGILQLSVEQRLELIEQIWDTLPEQISPEQVPAWHLEELERRRAGAEAQPALGKPWRDVLGPLEGST
jgi:putative addiction module component (TIGR02574 family)